MSIVLFLHNLNRWIVAALLILSFGRALWELRSSLSWSATDSKLSLFSTITMDIQLLLGLLLFFVLSPLTTGAFQKFFQAMQVTTVRFFTLEHTMYMLLAIVFAHIGQSRAKKAAEDVAKQRAIAIFFGLALLFLILGMPWFRPLLPHF